MLARRESRDSSLEVFEETNYGFRPDRKKMRFRVKPRKSRPGFDGGNARLWECCLLSGQRGESREEG